MSSDTAGRYLSPDLARDVLMYLEKRGAHGDNTANRHRKRLDRAPAVSELDIVDETLNEDGQVVPVLVPVQILGDLRSSVSARRTILRSITEQYRASGLDATARRTRDRQDCFSYVEHQLRNLEEKNQP